MSLAIIGFVLIIVLMYILIAEKINILGEAGD